MSDSARSVADDHHPPPRDPVHLDDASEYEALLERQDLVLLEFVTAGCGICASMEPVLGSVARAAPGVVAVADAADVPDLAAEFDVRSVPTLVVLENDTEVARLDDGFQPAGTLVELLESHADR